MKLKQSTGKEGKRKERKDKKDNNDKKNTDSKSKSITQKKRRRYTHKKKKAKLMKKRSIRRQRGGIDTPEEEKEAADDIERAMNEEKKRRAKAAALGKEQAAKEIAKQSARDTVSMLKKPLTKKETKLLRRLVFFNIYKPTNELRTDKYTRLQNIYDNIYSINYDSVEKINFVINELLTTNIFSGAKNKSRADETIKKFYVDVSNQVIDEIDINKVLLPDTQERISKMNKNDNNKVGYGLIKQKVKIINSLINKRNEINIKEKKQPKQIKEELSEVESQEIVKRELAKRKAEEAKKSAKIAEARQAQAEAEAEDAKRGLETEKAKRIKAVAAAKKAAEHLKNLKVVQATRKATEANDLKQETTDLLTSIKGKLEDINKNYMNPNFIQNDIQGEDGILHNLLKNYGTIQELHKLINELNSSIKEIIEIAPEDIKDTLATATKTLEKATTEANKLKEIIQVLQIINNNFDIINGNTPGTKKEDKLSKIAEQKYIVIPDPSNNINKDYFCKGGIPAKAKNYKYYIIFLDGYEGTEVKYNNIPIRLTKKQHNIENCLSKK
jgi:hypothetical protein